MAQHKALKRTRSRVNRANGQLGSVPKMMADMRHPKLIYLQTLAVGGAVKRIANDDVKEYTAEWLSAILTRKINASALSAEEDLWLRTLRRNMNNFTIEQLLDEIFRFDGLHGCYRPVKK